MAKKGRRRATKPPTDEELDGAQQGTLVPMSETELQDAGRLLAGKVKELRDLKTNHAGQRSEMKQEREDLQKEIDRIAGTIRQQGR